MKHGGTGTQCQAVLKKYYSLIYLTWCFSQTKDMIIFPPLAHQKRQHYILNEPNTGKSAAKSKLVNKGGHVPHIYQHSPVLVVSCHPLCF